MDIEAPRRTGKPLEEITLQGCLMPVDTRHQPCWLRVPGSDGLYLPLFNKETDARQLMGRIGIQFDKLTRITDGPEFLESIPFFTGMTPIFIILDPHFVEGGNVRWTEIQRSQA